MNKDSIHRELSAIPRERSALGFTDDVLRRLDSLPPPVRSAPRRLLVVVAVAVLALPLALRIVGPSGPSADVLELQELRDEHQALAAELARLRGAPAEARLLFLAGDDQVDLVVDLDRLNGGSAAARTDHEHEE